MNFFQIISEIEKVDPEVYERLDSRRAIFKNMGGLGKKLSAAALPLAVGAIFNKAYAQTTASIAAVDVLNFALKLEYLESYFYTARTGITSQLSTLNAAALALIATDEANHVSFLRTTITALNGTPIPVPATTGVFDYTAGGMFPTALTNAGVYLAIAQSFEDTGVRAYKGAAPLPNVMANKTVLTAALNIHSVEARHASHIRAMRRAGLTSATPAQGIPVAPYSGPTGAPKSWISGNDGNGAVPGFTDGIYGAGNNTGAPTGITFDAESVTTQANVNLVSNTTITGFPTSAFSEAFDEGLDVGTVAAIANKFTTAANSRYFG